ncbi:hypothetical protein T4E_619 [Trichinella pseudospiralis]|uniref:Secreted protein n=1 Tax=Trichinella pseudospiralis TaxID=6337 RepID=A0A0V0YL84_TRIPS|nr:hypothetical protein T4E_619 [Trichinella pseudospiralis]
MTSTLLLAVVASVNRTLSPLICSTASAMFSVQPNRRSADTPRRACCTRFSTITTGWYIRWASVDLAYYCHQVTARVRIFTGRDHIPANLTQGWRGVQLLGVQPFRSGNTYAVLVAVRSRLPPSHSHLEILRFQGQNQTRKEDTVSTGSNKSSH